MERISRGPADHAGLEFAFRPPERTGRVVFELEDASLQAGEKSLLRGAELWLERGEHVSLVGANGSGKTTLIETLAGRRELRAPPADPDGLTGVGKLRSGHNVKLGYLSQHAEELNAGNARTVVEATQHATGLTPGKARALLGGFLFSGEDAEKPLDGLSGGERRRLSLAILVHSGANVLILDEPTNHLDLESREALEAALRAFPGTLLLVSHDRALLDAIGTRTVALEDQTLNSYVGGWPEYLRVREERAKTPAAPKPPATKTPAATGVAAAEGRRDGRKRTPPKAKANGKGKGSGSLEQQIEAAEAALQAVEEELADPAAWATPEATARSTARHEQARQSVAELYRRWETVAG
jgi:ATP-binding cassette subfamily F protein 3